MNSTAAEDGRDAQQADLVFPHGYAQWRYTLQFEHLPLENEFIDYTYGKRRQDLPVCPI